MAAAGQARHSVRHQGGSHAGHLSRDADTNDLLFDLYADIGERRNLYYEHPDIVRDLKARYRAWANEMDASERQFLVK